MYVTVTFKFFTCIDEFGYHDNHSSCPSMLSQMVNDSSVVVPSPKGRVYVIESNDESVLSADFIFTPYGPAIIRSIEVMDSGAVKVLSSKGWVIYNDVATYNDASTKSL